jgi:hypothetical protein
VRKIFGTAAKAVLFGGLTLVVVIGIRIVLGMVIGGNALRVLRAVEDAAG